jgi:hypothetical protein
MESTKPANAEAKVVKKISMIRLWSEIFEAKKRKAPG